HLQRLFQFGRINPAPARAIVKHQIAIATEIDLEPPEHSGSPTQCRRDVSDGTSKPRNWSNVNAHREPPSEMMPHRLSLLPARGEAGIHLRPDKFPLFVLAQTSVWQLCQRLS